MKGITTSEGELFEIDSLYFLGFQIEHKVTGRRLPMTQSFEVFTESAARYKMLMVDAFLKEAHNIDIVIDDYYLTPVTKYDLKAGWHLITTEEDW